MFQKLDDEKGGGGRGGGVGGRVETKCSFTLFLGNNCSQILIQNKTGTLWFSRSIFYGT